MDVLMLCSHPEPDYRNLNPEKQAVHSFFFYIVRSKYFDYQALTEVSTLQTSPEMVSLRAPHALSASLCHSKAMIESDSIKEGAAQENLIP